MSSKIIIYQTEDGETMIDVRLENETVWLSQSDMANLFQTTTANINQHIKNVFKVNELDKDRTVKDFLIVRDEGKRKVRRKVVFYNLDMIISIGYRVNTHRGVHFRRWATTRLKEYLIKGFTMDEDRLKHGRSPLNYFEELYQRVRAIRTSERNFYAKVLEIYRTSIDYDPESDMSQMFFATIQNKFHWAIHGHTAAELISKRIDAERPNMGLTTWRGNHFNASDLEIAKNFLTEEELENLRHDCFPCSH
ncbi:MAG: RhuM family protein, partial [Bacteroidota bacterium]